MFLLSCNPNLLVIIKLLRRVLWYVTILVPIILIALGTFDLLKAVTASKEDEIKAAQKLLIKRVIYAILIFLLYPLVNLVFGLFKEADVENDTSYTSNWVECWNEAKQS